MAKKSKRGFKFTVAELEHMLDIINNTVPIGNPDWEKVWQEHLAAYPTMEQTPESLKYKFKELVHKKNPTGDPPTVLLMFVRPREFKENCYCDQWVDRRFKRGSG
jgi:hypothetical protein